MKPTLYIILLCLILSFPTETSAQSYYFITDSVQLYAYDQQSGQWTYSGVTGYYYSSGSLESAVTTDGNHQLVSQTFYTYNNGLLAEVLTQVFKNGAWSDSQQQFLYYDSDNLLRERTVAKWNLNQWQNLNRFTYIYDNNNKLKVYNRETWKNDQWTDFSVDTLFYSAHDLLISRIARLRSSGAYITRQFYNYNIYGQKIRQLRQDYIDGAWVNVSRINYSYNPCGSETGTLTENWSDGAWHAASRGDDFYHYIITGRRIPVCYKGVTIYLKNNAVQTYLDLGACLGQCQSSSNNGIAVAQNAEDKSLTAPFIVYPNPVSDRVVIRLTDPEQQVSTVELLDYYGRLLKSINPGEETEISLDLSDLKSGSYILRVKADSVYSIIISRN
jgi:hypothetical protein